MAMPDTSYGAGPLPLTPTGVAVLLVYGAEIKVARDGQPGIRITAGYQGGTVLLEAVGFANPVQSIDAIMEAHQACADAGLRVEHAPHRMTPHHARIVSRMEVAL